MNECSKAVVRRMYDPLFVRKYFVGQGIDIGCGQDSLNNYCELFPLMDGCAEWDIRDGDAQFMKDADQYDFVHSSHCLEHLDNPFLAIDRWIEILKPGGHLVCIVPDEDLYEQGTWPSTFNSDHKHTFTIMKHKSWSPVSINVIELLFRSDISIQSIKLLNATHRKMFGKFDQTLTYIGESAIEFVVRKEMK